MRLLSKEETIWVSGGGRCVPTEGEGEGEGDGSTCTRRKNNNGYGNGPESGPPPGNSGLNNPQLLGWNRGPKGPR